MVKCVLARVQRECDEGVQPMMERKEECRVAADSKLKSRRWIALTFSRLSAKRRPAAARIQKSHRELRPRPRIARITKPHVQHEFHSHHASQEEGRA